ncbi:MAG: hypothetical protein Q4B29_00485 [Candidatus Saccharibacteria bacterium]|nr:hypothetical protein [Candidatus Saccharibacteria bacterium]
MKNNRSEYHFQIINAQEVNNLITKFLQTNKFTLQNKNGEQYFRSGEPMFEGYKYFSYAIQGQTLTIWAWLKSALGEFPIEQNNLSTAVVNYRNILSGLFQEIERLSQASTSPQAIQPQAQTQFSQAFQNETLKKQETMCEVGFWFSLIGLVISFFGFAYGAIIYAMDLCFAVQGLRTRKKSKAIATIIISVISIVIVGIQFILEATKA